jgi:rRNA maturation endonuclease Nob1
MKDDWITCGECESEFKIISDSIENADYCPFCGEFMEQIDEEEDMVEDDE